MIKDDVFALTSSSIQDFAFRQGCRRQLQQEMQQAQPQWQQAWRMLWYNCQSCQVYCGYCAAAAAADAAASKNSRRSRSELYRHGSRQLPVWETATAGGGTAGKAAPSACIACIAAVQGDTFSEHQSLTAAGSALFFTF